MYDIIAGELAAYSAGKSGLIAIVLKDSNSELPTFTGRVTHTWGSVEDFTAVNNHEFRVGDVCQFFNKDVFTLIHTS